MGDSATMVDDLICLETVGFSHHGTQDVLRGVDLVVRRGSRLALLGANGAGKTSLLLHLNGTLRPRYGRVSLDGKPVSYSGGFLREWRRRVGVLFQDPEDQIVSACVIQDVAYGPLNLGLGETEAEARAREALASLAIGDLWDRPAHRLSYGQKKRVALAGLLAMRPEVLVLDEPTAGLDSAATDDLRLLLGDLGAQGVTVVIATHDVDFAWDWASEVALLHQGVVKSQGPAAEILGDERLMAACRLRSPMVLATARALREAGLSRASGRLPRSMSHLLAEIAAEGP